MVLLFLFGTVMFYFKFLQKIIRIEEPYFFLFEKDKTQLFRKKMFFFHQLGNRSLAKSRFLAALHTRYGGEVEKKFLGSEIIFNKKSCAAGARIIVF